MPRSKKAPTKKAEDPARLVTEGVALDERIKADSARLREIKAALVAAGPGDYQGAEGARAAVIDVGSSIKLVDLDAARLLAGDAFGKLFDRITSHRPVKAFREVAAALLPKAKARRLIEACEVENAPQVRFKREAGD